ncbi:MAG: methionyl-tRNA formyltransferase [Myxococcota bacterium]|nr:methionyl-tRNA formyltransferase [Myxococcota bacterium]
MAFFGTPALATPTLAALIDGPHEVVCVVSQPDRARGRGRKTSPSPVSQLAQERGVPVLAPEKINDAIKELRGFSPDIGVVVAYGQFIPKKVRELPSCGYLINAHASLLPKLRGAAPIARAIFTGETQTGVSVMRVEREMDGGPVALVRELEIGAEENTAELEVRVGELAAVAIAQAVELIANDRIEWNEQDASLATEAAKLERSEAQLDWLEPATQLALRIRAFAPRPGAQTLLDGEALRILGARVSSDPCDRAPGSVQLNVEPGTEPLRIATSEGWLVPTRLQRAGGKPLATADFLRGRPIADGTQLGASEDAGSTTVEES